MISLLALATSQLRSKFVGLAGSVRFYDLGVATRLWIWSSSSIHIFSSPDSLVMHFSIVIKYIFSMLRPTHRGTCKEYK